MTSANRYEGKPLLRLLELYVLKAIDELSAADEANLTAMAPTLAKVYGRAGTWSEIIAGRMEFAADMPDEIRRLWQENQEIAKAHGVDLTPQHFAEMIVDQNLT